MSCEVEDPCGSYSTCKDERVGAAELMDEYWFFHNMLDRARIFKPSTDACCSSTNKEMLLKDKHGGQQSPPRNLPKHDNPSNVPNFLRTPSLPPCIVKEKSIQCEEINGRSSTNSRLQRSFSSVANAPSLPPIANSHCSSSSKIRSQSATLKPGIPRRRLQPAEPSIEGSTRKDYKKSPLTTTKEVSFQRTCSIRSHKSLSQLQLEELQGFMDLGFVFDKAQISPNILTIIPGLQDKRPTEEDGSVHRMARPYLSEAWCVQRSVTPKVNWVDSKSAADIKEQLRAWARTVASNVHQEC